MLEDCRKRVGQHDGLEYRQLDIMDIPIDDASQDVVIANMMLYHVPDIHRGLSEVRRVLKPGGVFYYATYGENGLMKWLNDVFDTYKLDVRMNTEFTLQNGGEMLKQHFSSIKQLRYPDAFEITDTNDLVNYVLSMTSMAKLENVPREEIFALLDAKKENGVIHIPKEYGMFISE